MASLSSLRDAICMYVEKESDRGSSLDLITENVRSMLLRARLIASPTIESATKSKCQDDDLVVRILGWCGEFYSHPS